MATTIISALLPIVITLLFGFFAGWHHDFDRKQAAVLNRMVMLYALPLVLFAGMVGTPRSEIIAQVPLALAILLGMVVPYAIAFVIAHYLFRRDLMTASLEAITIGGPAVPFVGIPVLGQLFGEAASAVPIAIAGLVMNLIQVPATLMLLSAGMAARNAAAGGRPPPLMSHVRHALREPVVWGPILALILILGGVHFPKLLQDSFFLLGRATGGVALFASGIVLYSYRVKFDLPVGVSVLARNIVVPAVIWAVVSLAGFTPHMMRESVLTLAIPTAAIATILAVQYQAAEQEMASTLFFSTIFSIITMGGFIWLTG
ncbi:MAG: AEC family transporter [Acetobacteraceae bacterium]|nr:AEC family transporter [Acetobacteraceae bacterium]